ncbi:5'-methylthioadenosine/S-adenosylhomocysteine nucleosidase [Bradyrhizobium sp. CCGB12]|uniref:5'-methylthioadenosine/S-adenosylhomocysteine nucleosidase n=1 Tax=Bradyrhizobium sp. CCGB12 TaxID=2949632 RepID=UPI0020B1BA67|nr:5'-methylthioadenosine/S-adenosylhomocysteine nucleosidase [Bradyrhizobium sp. CCGB12]MCP3394924.1 5'-methylthioadenosine/S-adenosylhomocysteine nucleosidase [Bradyrhizobium sp. CCGB12]
MFARKSDLVLISNLKDQQDPDTNWFTEESPKGLAGRCLLDAIEYLHSAPKLPARFWHVVNAHAIRLVHRCLTDPHVNRPDVLERLKPHIEETCRQLLNGRQPSVPFYGDDYWDWASVVNAFMEVRSASPSAERAAAREMDSFHEAVKKRTLGGLSVGNPDREWYGPATAALAYRVLGKGPDDTRGMQQLLAQLKAQALETVVDGKYRGREIPARQLLWHYGQVVALFPVEAKEQVERLTDFSWSKDAMEDDERVFVLARVLQGAYAADKSDTIENALTLLYKAQTLSRPLGYGLMGDVVKGSLNVLDALWPHLKAEEKADIARMIDALLASYARNNTVGFIVAIDHEVEAIEDALKSVGATIEKKGGTTIVKHKKFRAAICVGKSLNAATTATSTLIEKHNAKWIIMSGVAGSLGKSTAKKGDGAQFKGPDKGDLVVATSMAPFHIRDKVREEIENAKVPFDGDTWMVIPTDPELFRLAHEAANEMKDELRYFYEGMIVSGTGIKDSAAEKKRILDEFPGGLAVEEEGYAMGIVCLSHHVPYLNIRGISDRAEGDKAKQKQDTTVENNEQRGVAKLAARLAVKVAVRLSERW